MTEKKSLLISWTSRTFIEVIAPMIPKLSEEFRIVVFLLDYSSPPTLADLLSSWQDEGIVEEYLRTPDYRKILRMHLFMKAKIESLREYDFDLCLAADEMQVINRYLLECVLPKRCVFICMWHNITFLFMYNQHLVQQLLRGGKVPEYLPLGWGDKRRSIVLSLHRLREIIRQESFAGIMKRAARFAIALVTQLNARIRGIRKKIRIFNDRILFPWLMVGKTFRLGPYDSITQLSSGRSGALIFFDELEAKAHQSLFKGLDVYVARYPSNGSCRCKSTNKRRTAILSPLSNFVGTDRIPGKALQLFYRDFQTVLLRTNAERIDLRLHPDETGEWPYQLRDYLLSRGIGVRVVEPKLPLREVVCDYLGVAGSASASLRDCRASCDYAVVIGFVGVSKFQLDNPKFAFANSEGIGWIEEDGSHDPGIFSQREYVSPARKTVPQILTDLSKHISVDH